MAIQINDNLLIRAPKPVDQRYGPWNSIYLVNSNIPLTERYKGLTVGVIDVNTILEYWWKDGVTNLDLILKTSGAGNNSISEATNVESLAGVVTTKYVSPAQWTYLKTQPATISAAWGVNNLGLSASPNLGAYLTFAANTSTVGSWLMTPSAIDYTGSNLGTFWNNGGEIKFVDAGTINNRLLKTYNNNLYKGFGTRMLVTNAAGDLSATDIVTEQFILDTDIITSITGATYTNNKSTITPANSKSFFQGQMYETNGIFYIGVDDNKVLKIESGIAGGGSSGSTSFSAIGSSPNASGATISSGIITLQPASESFGGILTNATQSISGAKNFTTAPVMPRLYLFNGTSSATIDFVTTNVISSSSYFMTQGNGENVNDAILGYWNGSGRPMGFNWGIDGSLNFITGFTRKLELNTGGILNYSSDVSGSYTTRSLIDKGYADATYGSASGLALKANDNAVVHLAGAETITGAKTFSSNLNVTGATLLSGNVLITNGGSLEVQKGGTTSITVNNVQGATAALSTGNSAGGTLNDAFLTSSANVIRWNIDKSLYVNGTGNFAGGLTGTFGAFSGALGSNSLTVFNQTALGQYDGSAEIPATTGYALTVGDIGGSGNSIDAFGRANVGSLVASGIIRLRGYTVATLPTGMQGDTAFVTNASTPTYGAIVVGGGTVVTKVFFNGTNWTT